MDAVARTEELLGQGNTVEEVVRKLRAEGFTLISSIGALVKAGGVSFSDAKAAVLESPVWADQRDRLATNRWVAPPEVPDEKSVERMCQVCVEIPQIAEVWVTGSEMTRRDGSSNLATALAIILDPPATDVLDPDERATTDEIMERLEAAWTPSGRRAWIWAKRGTIARRKDHCVAIYSRLSITRSPQA